MIFDLYWIDYDSQESFLFEKDTSKEQFISDCNLALKRAGEEILQQVRQETSHIKAWITASDWTRAAAKELEKMGYFPIRPKYYRVSGGIIDDPKETDVSFTDGVNGPYLGEIVGEDLLKKVIAHNASIREEQDQRMKELREKAKSDVDNKS